MSQLGVGRLSVHHRTWRRHVLSVYICCIYIYAGRRTHDDVARVFECSTDEIRKAESSALRRRAAYYCPLLP